MAKHVTKSGGNEDSTILNTNIKDPVRQNSISKARKRSHGFFHFGQTAT